MTPLIKILIKASLFVLTVNAVTYAYGIYTEHKAHKDEVKRRVDAVKSACEYFQYFPDELIQLIAPSDATAANIELMCEKNQKQHK